MKLKDLLTPQRIKLGLQAKSAEDVIDDLVNLLAETGAISDSANVRKRVIEREKQVGTGIGYGVAIPHAEPGPYSEPVAAFARLEKPVDFHAPDGKKAELVFLLLTPEDTPALHVRLLARICRLTRSENRRRKLLEVKTEPEAAEVISELERAYPELTA